VFDRDRQRHVLCRTRDKRLITGGMAWHGVMAAGVCASVCMTVAVQNERDRISVRRPSYDDVAQTGALSVATLHNAELLSRQVTCNAYQLTLYVFSIHCLSHGHFSLSVSVFTVVRTAVCGGRCASTVSEREVGLCASVLSLW